MSATLDRSLDEPGTIDLREQEFTIPSVSSSVAPPRDQRAVLRRRRRIVVGVLAGLVVAFLLQYLVGTLMAGQRQRHLAYEFTVPESKITPGAATILLQAPSIGLNVVVAEGASSEELRGGPGRVIGSAQLADGGNVVVLGRRTRFGATFARLPELSPGDPIVAKSRSGAVRAYTVDTVRQVPASSVAALRSTEDRLTLITSGSGILPAKRLVVVARALAPPAGAAAAQPDAARDRPTSVQARLSVDALDERSTSVVGLGLALVLLVVAAFGAVLGIRRLRSSYRLLTTIQAVVPMALLVLIVVFVIGDSLLPTTF